VENEDYSPLDSLVRLSSELPPPGMAGSSLGVAASGAEYLQASGTAFRRDLTLLFTCLKGAGVAGCALERFLDRRTEEWSAAFQLTGTSLGAVTSDPLGTCRLAISVRTRDREVLAGGGADSGFPSSGLPISWGHPLGRRDNTFWARRRRQGRLRDSPGGGWAGNSPATRRAWRPRAMRSGHTRKIAGRPGPSASTAGAARGDAGRRPW
jgi:hypothetical protein